MTDLPALVHGVRLLSLDAGNTVIFLDHGRLAALAAAHGFVTSAEALIRTEGSAKRRHARADMLHVRWANEAEPGAKGWGGMVATILAEAGFPVDRLGPLLEDVWKAHVQRNLWSLVPDGFSAAIGRVRARGTKVVLVSNSEGMLDRLFVDLGIRDDFDLLLDSGKIGLEKPDPRIFALALERYRVAPAEALHLGDIYSTDVLGARAAGMRAALVDPYRHYEGLFEDVPRVPGVVAVAEAIAMDRER